MNPVGEGRAQASSERRAPRERAFLQGRVSFANGSMSFTCRVTQISTTGCRIALESHAPLPERIRIAIPQRGIDTQARLVWRSEDSAALAFLGGETAPGADADHLRRRLRELEAENAALKARITLLLAEIKQKDEGY